MPDSDTKLRSNDLYAQDFYAWTQEQARLLREQHWNDLDTENLADEIASLGAELKREIRDRLEILLSYLLKWRHLPEYRGFAWKENISRQRGEIAEILVENGSLAEKRAHLLAHSYENARRRLKYETYFFTTDFPSSCPFSERQVFDPNFFPEELDAPSIGQFPTAHLIGE